LEDMFLTLIQEAGMARLPRSTDDPPAVGRSAMRRVEQQVIAQRHPQFRVIDQMAFASKTSGIWPIRMSLSPSSFRRSAMSVPDSDADENVTHSAKASVRKVGEPSVP